MVHPDSGMLWQCGGTQDSSVVASCLPPHAGQLSDASLDR